MGLVCYRQISVVGFENRRLTWHLGIFQYSWTVLLDFYKLPLNGRHLHTVIGDPNGSQDFKAI